MSLLGRLFSRSGMDHYRRGIVHFNRREYAEAADAFEQAIGAIQDPRHPYHGLGRFYAAEARAKIGVALFAQGRHDEARGQFRAALDAGYRYPDVHYLLARTYLNHGGLPEAEEQCRAALAINARYHDARAWLAIGLARQGRSAEAEVELAELARNGFTAPGFDPICGASEENLRALAGATDARDTDPDLMDRALEAYHRGDVRAAIGELQRAVVSRPRYADLRCRLGTLHLEVGELEQAAEQLGVALEINPRYVEARLQMGLCELRRDRPTLAAEHLEVAAEVQPEYPDVRLFLALACLREGRFSDAERWSDEALRFQPELARARYVRSLVLFAQGDDHRAQAELERSVEIDPSLQPARAHLLSGTQWPADPARTRTGVDRALSAEPQDASSLFGRAVARIHAGDPEGADRDLEQTLALCPRSIRARLLLAELRLQRNLPALAEQQLRAALEAMPEHPDVHHLLGHALAAQGRNAEAAVAYRNAVSRNAGDLEARATLGLLLIRTGEVAAARLEFEQVLRVDPFHAVARAFVDPGLVPDLM